MTETASNSVLSQFLFTVERNLKMFNLKKRKRFTTIGELETILRTMPADTPITICGDSRCFYHEALDRSVVCLDCEDLAECYTDTENREMEDGPLTIFLKEEVSSRLSDSMELPDYLLTKELILSCVAELDEKSELIFNHDRIDELLTGVLKKRGIDPNRLNYHE